IIERRYDEPFDCKKLYYICKPLYMVGMGMGSYDRVKGCCPAVQQKRNHRKFTDSRIRIRVIAPSSVNKYLTAADSPDERAVPLAHVQEHHLEACRPDGVH